MKTDKVNGEKATLFVVGRSGMKRVRTKERERCPALQW